MADKFGGNSKKEGFMSQHRISRINRTLGSTLLHFLSLVHHLINWAMSFSCKDLGKWVIFKWISGKAKGQKGWVFSLTRSKGRKKWKKASYSPHSVFFSWLKDFPANLSFTRPFCSLADMKRPTQRSRLRLDHFVGLFMCLRLQKGLVNDNYAGKLFVTQIKPNELSKILWHRRIDVRRSCSNLKCTRLAVCWTMNIIVRSYERRRRLLSLSVSTVKLCIANEDKWVVHN